MRSELELRMRLRHLMHVRSTYDVQEAREAWDHVRPYAAPDSSELLMRLDASISTLQWALDEGRRDTIIPDPMQGVGTPDPDESGSGIMTALGAITGSLEPKP